MCLALLTCMNLVYLPILIPKYSLEKNNTNPVLPVFVLFSFGDPYGNRTHAFAVRGRRLSRLTKGPWFTERDYYSIPRGKKQGAFEKIFKGPLFRSAAKGNNRQNGGTGRPGNVRAGPPR